MNWKECSEEKLKKLFSNIKFKTPLYKHQLASLGFIFEKNLNRVMLILDIGLGKTYLSLALLQLWKVNSRTLIICPNSVIKTWKDEIEKHTNFTYTILKGTKEERLWKINNEKKNIFLINYEGLKLIGGKKDVKGFKVDIPLINSIPFECMIMDESHHCRNPLSLQTRIAKQFSLQNRYVILMTGTPIGDSAADLFGQCLVLDNGKTFGDSYYRFLNNYYFKRNNFDFKWLPKRVCNICGELYCYKKKHLEKHNTTLEQYRKKFSIEKTSEDLIIDKVSSFSISYKRDECLNLPEKIYEERSVFPTREQQKMTAEIIAGLKINELNDSNITYHTTKLVQITGGTILHGNEKPYIFLKNPKMDELLNLIKEITGKAIIYHYYLQESNLIKFELEKKGYKVAILNGTIKDKEAEIDKFLSTDCNFMICHPKSGGEGLNLQIANTIIYYSNGYIGTILREQSEGRIHRVGQTKSCVYIDIICENTIDRILFNSLKNKTDYIQDILQYLRKK